jgi:hypothetical protein
VGGWDVEGVEEVVQDEGAQASSSCGCYAELFFWVMASSQGGFCELTSRVCVVSDKITLFDSHVF